MDSKNLNNGEERKYKIDKSVYIVRTFFIGKIKYETLIQGLILKKVKVS